MRSQWGLSAITLTPLLLLALWPIGAIRTSQHTTAPDDGPPGNASWVSIFDDEFNASNYDTSHWSPCYWWGDNQGCTIGNNGEMEWYQPANVSVSNGLLHLTAMQQTVQASGKTYHYTSGMVASQDKFSFLYGYWESRFRVPAGTGFWPAFWIIPEDQSWPPEIDAMEILGSDPHVIYMTVHWGGNNSSDSSPWTGPSFATDFHTVGVDWEPDHITWYVDGVARKTTTNPAAIPRKAMYIVLNLAVGGHWPGPPTSSTVFPNTFDIDYVRVWQHTNNTPVAAPSATATKAAPLPTATAIPNPSVTTTPTPTLTTTPVPDAVAGISTTALGSPPSTPLNNQGIDIFPWLLTASFLLPIIAGVSLLLWRRHALAQGAPGDHRLDDHRFDDHNDDHWSRSF